MRSLRVTAPSRLHCGLLSLRGDRRRFGGAGLMIREPAVQISLTDSLRFEIQEPEMQRVAPFVECWQAYVGMKRLKPCSISVDQIPPPHVGLGTGTQLALATATALTLWHDLPAFSPTELAQSVGRGGRSAIGTYGFCGGGFIVDRGKEHHEAIAALDCRMEIPEPWRFVLIRPSCGEGLSGPREQAAFDRVRSDDESITTRLRELLRLSMVPAVARGDFAAFSESLYEYGHASGLLFAEEQGGPYNGRVLHDLVRRAQGLGIVGVAQSSWGPTLFAVLPDQEAAIEFASKLTASQPVPLVVRIAAPSNQGARIEINP